MVVLAFVSGRGVITATAARTHRRRPPPSAADAARIAIVDAAGGLSTTDELGGSLIRYGQTGTKFSFPHLVAGRQPDRCRRGRARRDGDRRVHGAGRGCDARRSGHRLQQRGSTAVLRVLVARRARPVVPDDRARWPRTPSGPCRCERAGGRHPQRGADVLVVGGSDATPRPQRRRGPGRVLRRGSTRRGRHGADRDPGRVFRVPAVSGDGRFRAFATPGEATPQRIVLETRDRAMSACGRRVRRRRLRFRPGIGSSSPSSRRPSRARAPAAGRTAAPDGRRLRRGADAARRAGSSPSSGRRTAKTVAALSAPEPGDDNVAGRGSRDARLERLRAGRRDGREAATSRS